MSEKSTVGSNQQCFMNLTEHVENDFINQIDEDDFYELVEDFDLDFSIFEKRKTIISKELIENFNKFILKCKQKLGINIYDSLIFIEKRYTSFSKLISLLTEDNYQILTKEMASKYRIKIRRTSLNEFLSY